MTANSRGVEGDPRKPKLAGADQLFKALFSGEDSTAGKDVSGFFAACAKRPKADLVQDVLQYNAHLKAAIKNHRTNTPDGPVEIIEFSETFPVDNLKDTAKAFDPVTCLLEIGFRR